MSAGCNSQGMLGRLTSTVAFGVTNPTQTKYRDPLFGIQISKTFLAKKLTSWVTCLNICKTWAYIKVIFFDIKNHCARW